MKKILSVYIILMPFLAIAQIDPVITTPATPQIIGAGLKSEAKALAILAYQWGYPLVRMEQTVRKYTTVEPHMSRSSFRAPVNQIGWSRQLPGPKDTDMPTANNDTYYMSAVLALDEPFLVSVPDTKDRYYVINVFDMYHNLTEYIGRRNTGTEAGEFWIVPPQWDKPLPKEAKMIIRPKTNKVWLWGRIAVAENEDVNQIYALQDQFKVEPISKVKNELPEWEEHTTEFGFFYNLAQAMKYNPILPDDKALVALFERIGLKAGSFDPSKLHPLQIQGIKEAMAEAPATIISNTATAGVNRDGWVWASDIDNFGFNYGLRALVSGPYLGGQGEKEAMYPIRYNDSENKVLTGENEYTIHFETLPDVGAFWSVTVYDAESKMLVENPINRYKISPTTPKLKYNKNGGLDITLSHKKPSAKENWLPVSEGEFYLLLRLYQPSESILNGTYQLPTIIKK